MTQDTQNTESKEQKECEFPAYKNDDGLWNCKHCDKKYTDFELVHYLSMITGKLRVELAATKQQLETLKNHIKNKDARYEVHPLVHENIDLEEDIADLKEALRLAEEEAIKQIKHRIKIYAAAIDLIDFELFSEFESRIYSDDISWIKSIEAIKQAVIDWVNDNRFCTMLAQENQTSKLYVIWADKLIDHLTTLQPDTKE